MSRESLVVFVLAALLAIGLLLPRRRAKNRGNGEKRGKLS